MQQTPDLVVFCHLRWDFVWQRPQHLLTRLATDRRVFFIEEPVGGKSTTSSWERRSPEPGVTVCRPCTPCSAAGFHDEQMPHLHALVKQLRKEEAIGDHVAWFYTPMALPLVGNLRPLAVVYDCMDELSGFRGAPVQMLEREAELLRCADVVFTGGPSLYGAKKDRHPKVHCFPSSVDLAHFGKARADLTDHPEQAPVPRPRLGFFGVIDERLDIPLLDAVAQARPDWQLVLIGPVVKIDPAGLPRRPNIHYFGQRAYQDLPAFLSGWDVCLLPFARNDATRFISPTKTLEYMAAEKPIVSTAIADVAGPYGNIVSIANTPEEFTAACAQALAATPEELARRRERMRSVLALTSWDRTAQDMSQRLSEAVASRKAAQSAAPVQESDSPGAPRPRGNGRQAGRSSSSSPVVVVGAGPTGLSAAYHLGEDALLLEQNDQVGGWCRSIQEKGFTFDFAGHIMFSNDSYVHEMYKLLLGDNVHWQDREAWIYSKNVYTRYPFQGALYGLPPDVIKECVLGAMEARFGPLKKSADKPALAPQERHSDNGGKGLNGYSRAEGNGNGNGNPKSVRDSTCKAGALEDCCADGVLESTARLLTSNGSSRRVAKLPGTETQNFEEFIYQVWGAGIAKHFAIPYNRKLWAVPLTEMETSWLGGRVPMPDLEEMLDGALKPVSKPMGPNARFGYPLRGGFQALMEGFVPLLKGPVAFNSRVAAVSPTRRALTLADGTEISYEQLISTMPLPVLIRLMGEEAPDAIRRAVTKLRYVSVRCVHLGIGRENLTDKHWIYYPEDPVFHRIFVQGNASPHCNPPGGFGLTCEITYHPQCKPLPCDGDDLIRRCIADCHKVGIFRPEDPVWAATQCDLPHAYVVYDHARPKVVAAIREWLLEQDILLAGRYSEWEYYNSDHAFLAGKKAAEKARALRTAPAVAAAV